ncbi:uncharacterized protein [Coffea arabica]|uniref:Transmembrane protein n=1 Tax=Coffea arabica TaxID=13443 RepID=A0A6P6SD88_COFAR|nr:uncharacterized protein LOC113690114 [Coffea arabica]
MGGWNSETTFLEKAVLRPIKQQSVVKGCGGSWREPFRILTTLLLSLLLPLSFLLLARLSTARHISAAAAATSLPSTDCRDDDHLLCFLFLFHYFVNTSTIVCALVCLITVAAFVHCLTAGPPASLNVTSSNRRCQSLVSVEPDAFRRLRLYAAWIILCTLQICVGLGIEGSISTDAGCSLMMRNFHSSPTPGWQERISSLLSRVIFIVGLHETTHFWSKSVVKPVVDDTVMGCVVKEERWMERVGMAMSFGGLWWWKLRDEVDALAAAVWELIMKKELQPTLLVVQEQGAGGLGVADLVGWWLYYLTVAIGSIRLIKGGIWLGMILLFKFRSGYLRRRRRDSVSDTPTDHDYQV